MCRNKLRSTWGLSTSDETLHRHKSIGLYEGLSGKRNNTRYNMGVSNIEASKNGCLKSSKIE